MLIISTCEAKTSLLFAQTLYKAQLIWRSRDQ